MVAEGGDQLAESPCVSRREGHDEAGALSHSSIRAAIVPPSRPRAGLHGYSLRGGDIRRPPPPQAGQGGWGLQALRRPPDHSGRGGGLWPLQSFRQGSRALPHSSSLSPTPRSLTLVQENSVQ